MLFIVIEKEGRGGVISERERFITGGGLISGSFVIIIQTILVRTADKTNS